MINQTLHNLIRKNIEETMDLNREYLASLFSSTNKNTIIQELSNSYDLFRKMRLSGIPQETINQTINQIILKKEIQQC